VAFGLITHGPVLVGEFFFRKCFQQKRVILYLTEKTSISFFLNILLQICNYIYVNDLLSR
jgi:hypothetical protein